MASHCYLVGSSGELFIEYLVRHCAMPDLGNVEHQSFKESSRFSGNYYPFVYRKLEVGTNPLMHGWISWLLLLFFWKLISWLLVCFFVIILKWLQNSFLYIVGLLHYVSIFAKFLVLCMPFIAKSFHSTQFKAGAVSPTELRGICEKGLLLITVTVPEMEVYYGFSSPPFSVWG